MLSRRATSYLFPILFLCAAVAAGFAIIPFIGDYRDELYEIMNGWDYRMAPMAPLSSAITQALGSVISFDYIYFKWYTWILNILAVSISGWWICRLGCSVVRCLWYVAFTLAALVVARFCDLTYGWDTYTILFTVIALVSMLRYLRTPALLYIINSSFWCALLALMRIPNFCVAGAAMICIMVSDRSWRQRGIDCAVFIAVFLSVCWGILAALYGGVGAYVDALQSFMINDHDPHRIEMAFKWCVAPGLIYMACICSVDYLVNKITLYVAARRVRIVFLLLTAYSLFFAFRQMGAMANYGLHMLTPAAVMLLTAMIFLRRPMRLERCVAMLAIFLFSCVPFVGSNLGITKYLVFGALPILIYYAMPMLKGTRAVTAAIVVPVILWMFITRSRNEFHDTYIHTDFSRDVTEAPIRKFHGMVMPAEMARKMDAVNRAVTGCTAVYPVGEDIHGRYVYEYAYGWTNPMLRHEWGRDSLFDDNSYAAQLAAMADTLQPGAAIVLLPQQSRADVTGTIVYDSLATRLRRTVNTDRFVVFMK